MSRVGAPCCLHGLQTCDDKVTGSICTLNVLVLTRNMPGCSSCLLAENQVPLPAVPSQELHSALKKFQAELSQYSHVNKKALDQFTNFTEQREELTRRVVEIRQSGAHSYI